MKSVAITLFFLLLLPTSLFAEQNCKVEVIFNVAALDNPYKMMDKGEILDYATQYRKTIYKKSGAYDDSYCQNGGYCYPAHIEIKEKKIQSLKLLNCKLGQMDIDNENEYTKEELHPLK